MTIKDRLQTDIFLHLGHKFFFYLMIDQLSSTHPFWNNCVTNIAIDRIFGIHHNFLSLVRMQRMQSTILF